MVPKHLVFFDSRVAGYKTLIASLSMDTEWYLLDVKQDGIEQILSVLARYSQLDSVHILSHGAVATLYLGNTVLSTVNLDSYQTQLESIGNSLTGAGDILIYGCNVAHEDIGVQFIDSLAQITGADVAASTDASGSTVLGGNSVLEKATGAIDTSALSLESLWGVLAANSAPRFGEGAGIVTTAIGTGQDYGRSVTVQADGKILVAGDSEKQGGYSDFALVRYNSNGSLDTSFSGDGKLTTDIGGFDAGRSVALQADGKILIAGSSDSNFAILRYNSDGSLYIPGTSPPTTFENYGWLLIPIAYDLGYAVAVQTDGKILIAGSSDNGTGYDFALVRLTARGLLDTEFSGDGKLTTSINPGWDWGRSVTVQADGKILVAGYSGNGSNNDFALVRYNANGSLDTSFSGDGKVTTGVGTGQDYGYSVAVQADGKILVAGASFNGTTSEFALVRLNSNGSLDTSFSGDGKLTTGFDTFSSGQSMALQSDSKILVAGSSGKDFALVRYNTDGSLDTSFSEDGKLTTSIGDGNESGLSIAVQADGKILVAGSSEVGTEHDFALARYNADGSLDRTFGSATTYAVDDVPSYVENSVAVILDRDVQIFDAELSALNNFSGATITLVRSTGRNSQDLFFGSGIASGKASGNVTVASTVIGSYTYTAGTLTLLFNNNATQSLVNLTLQSLAYSNNSDTPPASVQIVWTFNDGNAGAQGTGGALSVSGSTTVNITPVNDAPTGNVTVSGTATQGQTLTASHTLADADGMPTLGPGAISYQWKANGINIAGATSATYTLTQAEVAKTVTAMASYTDQQGTAESVSSAGTAAVANVNDAPTGNVTVSGTATQGQTLSASHTLADADGIPTSGPGAISYQWKANGINIAGATSASYTLTQAEVAKTIVVVASYTDQQGKAESVSSNVTAAVTNVNDAPTGSVTVSGTATQGQTLTAGHTLTDADGIPTSGPGAIRYQWKANGINITGATSATYTLTQAEVAKTIAVVVSYTDQQGTAESVSSAATSAVVRLNHAPTGGVTITGTARQGQTLSAAHTVADLDGIPASGTGALRWQWYADGAAIALATSSTLTPGQSLVGKSLTAAIVYTDNFGVLESVSSAATAVVANVNDAPTGLLSVTGTYAQGQVLTASNTLADLDGLGTISLQWQAGGVDLVGASGNTLSLTQAHVGATVRVKASYTDGQGTVETVFSAGASVANVNDAPVLTPRSPVFTATGKTANPGQTTASLLGTSVRDIDTGALQGVAVHMSSGTGGTWEYSTNAGSTWSKLGSVSPASALLLRSTDLVRWLSDTGQGDVVSLSYCAWDQTTGAAGSKVSVAARGGTTAYSLAIDSATSDVVGPGHVMVLQDDQSAVASGPVVYTLALGENVEGVALEDFTVTGGSINALETLNKKFYQITVTPMADSAGQIRLALRPDAFKWVDGQASASLTSEPQYFLTRSSPPDTLTLAAGTIYPNNKANLVSAVKYGASSYYYIDNGNGSDYVRGNALNTGFTERGLSYTLPSASELSALFKNAYIPTSSGIWPASGNKYWSSTTGYYAGERSYVSLGSLGSIGNGQITSQTGSQNYDAHLAYRVSVDQAIYPLLETTSLHEKYTPEATLSFLLHKASATRISVPLSLGGTASLGSDYSLSGNYLLDQGVHYLVFEPGSTLSQLQVRAVNDAVAEGVETLSIVLQAGSNIYLGQSTFSLSIVGSELFGDLGIVGNAQQGQTLSVSNGLKESDANGLTPQIKTLTWLADNLPLSQSATNLLLTQDLVGKTIALRAVVTDSRGDEFTVQKAMAAAVANVNDAPTGVVSISGNLVQGQTLSASHTLADLDGMPSSGAGVLRYQWRADGLAIAGATAATYTLTQAEVGKSLSVLAQYTDLQGSPESVSSAASAAVANVNDAPAGGLQITGSAAQGQVLSVSQTLSDLDGIPTTGAGALRYQWKADDVDIAGATSASYTLTQAMVGQRISVSASYVDGLGQAESVSSVATTAVLNVNDAPQGGVFISGTAVQGRTLTASQTLSDLDGIPTSGSGAMAYQWLAGGVAINGATATTFTPTQAEVGKTLRVTASYVDGYGRQESVSSQLTMAVSNLNDPPSGSVSISGTPTQGQTLVASHNLSDPDGIPNSGTGAPRLQWRAAGLDVAGGTTASFTLTQAQVGLAMTVAVIYTDASGTTEVVSSAATAVVANINDAPTGTLRFSGSPTQGQVLSVVNSLADPDGMASSGTGAPRYQWQANGVDIKSATGLTYGLTQAEVGKTLSVIASYTDLQGTAESVTSPPTDAVANVNDRPSGAVRITGTPTQGQPLVASHTVSDLDGIPSSGDGAIRYQWAAAGQDMAGATSAMFTPTQAEVGKTLYVTVAYTDKYGTAESVRSVATTAVWNVNDPPTGDFGIIGTPIQGQTLRVIHTLADLDGIPTSGAGALRYQWLSNGAVIEGATSDSLVLTSAEVDRYIAVTAYYRDELGNFENVSSQNTQTVVKLNEAPVALAGTFSTQRGKSMSGTLSASDPDGDALTFLALSNPVHGTLDLDAATGRYSYQPEPGYVGADGFRFKVSDGLLDSPAVAVDLQVLGESAPVAPAPVFWKDSSKTLSSQKLAEAVSLSDAIAILKMIVGLPVNANNVALSPYQAIAADFDQNGEVELSDAIGVLKMVVGLSAPAPAWKYYDGDKLGVDFKAAASLSPKGWSTGAALSSLDNAAAEVKIVGVLTGDVDGSWLAP